MTEGSVMVQRAYSPRTYNSAKVLHTLVYCCLVANRIR